MRVYRELFFNNVEGFLANGFPVHHIGPGFQPSDSGERPTCLLVYRDPPDQVYFLEISQVTYALLDLLTDLGARGLILGTR